MKTYKIKRSERNTLVIEGFVLSKELIAIQNKMERLGLKVEDLPIRKWRTINLFDYDFKEVK